MSSRSQQFPASRPPRERSPPRQHPFSDRRPSGPQGDSYPSGGDSYRGSRYHQDSSSSIDRAVPPSGPRAQADTFRSSGVGSSLPSGPRGSNYPSRVEVRDFRNAPPLSDTRDRQWRDRDRDRDFDRRRNSPPRRSPSRLPRELDIGRARRDSRDGPPSAGSTYSDPPPNSLAPHGRGGFRGGRGRGGGDWDRGRDHYDNRNSFRPRSRSPRPRWEKETIRDERDIDRREDSRFDRRDDDRRTWRDERDRERERERETDRFKRESGPLPRTDTWHPPGASDQRHVGGTSTGQSTPTSTVPQSNQTHWESNRDLTTSRRASIAPPVSSTKDPRRESDKPDLILRRADPTRDRYTGPAPSPPPQAPQVPAFGSVSIRPPNPGAPTSNVWRAPHVESKPTVPAASTVSQLGNKGPPTAPKAQLAATPPTGPKAERVPDRPSSDQKQLKSNVEEGKTKDVFSIPTAVASAPVASRQTIVAPPPPPPPPPPPISPKVSQSIEPPTGPAAMTRLPPSGPANVPPIGPRSHVSPQPFGKIQQSSAIERDIPATTVPTGPRMSNIFSTSPKSLGANIPTGPKAERAPQIPSRSAMLAGYERPPPVAPRQPVRSNQWIRPGAPSYNRNLPIIPAKRDFSGEEKPPSIPISPKAHNTAHTQVSHSLEAPQKNTTQESISSEYDIAKRRQSMPTISSISIPQPDDTVAQKDDEAMSDIVKFRKESHTSTTIASDAPKPADDGSADEDTMDLDEDDFAEIEARFSREKARLESRKTDLSSRHLRATTPLEQLSMLAYIEAYDLPTLTSPVESNHPAAIRVPQDTDMAGTEIVTPKIEEAEDVIMEDNLTIHQDSVDRDSTPGLETLPFLAKGPPTPVSDLDQENAARREAMREAMTAKLAQMQERESTVHDDMRSAYAQSYREWRMQALLLDQERMAEKERQQSLEPVPAVSSEIVATPAVTPAAEGRRSHKFSSEYELNLAMEQSKREHEEMQAKKDLESKQAQADFEREAVILALFEENDAAKRKFIDTNHLREPGSGLNVFEYEPPKDVLTEEEHKAFVQAYAAYPKLFGKMAEQLPGRSYKECIVHYYSTKWNNEYKNVMKSRKGKGRGKGARLGRGRSTAIAADVKTGAEFEELNGQTLAVTDSGRPRRAAAPTFGEKDSEVEQNTPLPTPGRVRENGQEKPKRGKGVKEKSTRKGKAQPLAAAPTASPQKVDKPRKETTQPTIKTEEPLRALPRTNEESALLSNLHVVRAVERQSYFPEEPIQQVQPISTLSERPKSSMAPQRASASSYWSVQEQTDFRKNVAHFGTDYPAIASHMGTKTATMVKNHYQRLKESGNEPEVVRLAELADERRRNGEDMGPPPAPTQPVKRRYDTTQTAAPRPLAPNPEVVVDVENPPATQQSPRNASSPPQYSASRLPTLAQAGPAPIQGRIEQAQSQPPSRPEPHQQPMVSQHHRSQQNPPGPRLGFFTDERPESRPHIHGTQPTQQPVRQSIQATEPAQRPSQHQRSPSQRGSKDNNYRPLFMHHHREDSGSNRFSHVSQERLSQGLQHAPTVQQRPQQPSSTFQARPSMAAETVVPTEHRQPASEQASIQPRQSQSSLRHLMEASAQTVQTPPSLHNTPRQVLAASPPNEEIRSFPPPPVQVQQQPQPQQTPLPSLAATSSLQPTPNPTPRPPEPRKTSNLASLLNAEPEDPIPKKRYPEPAQPQANPSSLHKESSTPTQAQPPQGLRYDDQYYHDQRSLQSQSYSRPSYTPHAHQQQPHQQHQQLSAQHTSRPDLPTREHAIQHPPPMRDPWQPHRSFSQPNAPQSSSPHPQQAQSAFPRDSRPVVFDHRVSILGSLNTQPRHNPSPPPAHSYSHSRTNSYSQQPPQHHPPQHPAQHPAQRPPTHPPPGEPAEHVLAPNPYAQLQPPTQQSSQAHAHLQGRVPQSESAYGSSQNHPYASTPSHDPPVRGVASVLTMERERPRIIDAERSGERESLDMLRRDREREPLRFGQHTPQPPLHEHQGIYPPPNDRHTPLSRGIGHPPPPPPGHEREHRPMDPREHMLRHQHDDRAVRDARERSQREREQIFAREDELRRLHEQRIMLDRERERQEQDQRFRDQMMREGAYRR
ncbi:hypothetical protein M501DRAFT_1055817 [Patellaria atrata CBS 101060]|uniref:SANT domain-containing protein n=1 Tax=Patellaria atrata CBS 101060 TaxID=1346257 RepID=A0A9P4VTP5_9PEZI|nr:hypothetical protein M501DRAFT_1055817 [Patellaria atrata CBS 101060]